ncbi:NADPH:adrenodoxin oxidoreductase, mitochondrial [Lecanosticta acicola]|uniref:NADPH:adrenodoxin oxidoreductase, mitochondrial n=1 Tax=Lecanosticta acicola TaxID=111012 RepID=A0AAI9EEQ6_9PEZI|nr:NADPH:adrenodoxin oxidoreductase, mitochondrial [Lecanosticta acicola]
MSRLGTTAFVSRSCRQAQQYGTLIRRPTGHAGLRRYSSTPTRQRQRPLHLAIIGSGPAGFYSAYRLLKAMPDARVDMYESLPSPYGLVRFGIAPDHPEAKKCAETLPDVAKYDGFNYVGNVPIGDSPGHLPLTSIAPHYNALLFAYGASRDKKLGIPGEDLKGVLSARAFVGWYNGLPEYADLNPDLQSGDTAVVIGQGNVALDVARIMFMPLGELRKTDISEHALEALSRSRVKDMKIIGRRGPLQAPYTIKELREMLHISGLAFVPPPEGWEALLQVEPKKLPRQLKRITELLMKGSKTSIDQADKAWQLGYLRSPLELLSRDNTHLAAVGFEQQEYVVQMPDLITGDPQTDLNALRAAKVRGTGKKTMITAQLAFRSIGYESEALPGFDQIGVPFDTKKAIIPNDRYGRVLDPERGSGGHLTAGHVPGMYCAGWVKRGPTGVIASTLDDAFTTADIIVNDWRKNVKFNENGPEQKVGWNEVKKEVARRGIRSINWQDWEKIDAEEVRRGKEKGKEREKFRSVGEMLQVLDG